MKKKLIFIFLSLLMMCLLTGCQSNVDCATYGLPEGAKISYLVKDNETSTSAESDNNKNVPDGWRKIQYISDDYESVKQNDTIKIAVFDKDGKLLKVSPEFTLTIEDRNYYWSKLAYNYEKNSVEGIRTARIDNFISKWVFRLFVLDFIFFNIYLIVVTSITPKNYKSALWKMLVLNIPNIGIITLLCIDTFSDYFNPPGEDRFKCFGIILFFIQIVIIVNIFGAVRYCKCRRLAKVQEESE
ncbi:MAG: hypothetical protein E7495_01985 [Ruminococcus flavefaciens]|jgi:hypothetical protein|nr:hypothetical protein [Ruminococcus flavefaciens]